MRIGVGLVVLRGCESAAAARGSPLSCPGRLCSLLNVERDPTTASAPRCKYALFRVAPDSASVWGHVENASGRSAW
jgi:hypothetical protein